ncbi:hypothetical protein NCAS_0A13100 [Naumovozyma castellii]|uniref:YJR056C n=1 Tax=Naumovozyma castellii TaxID=27288 RepID=G0V8R9_NAUCA|nr:hypothetical protein NCAS_0A13100 [Naumovozyma castellii CBS 4309]CCC67868.1 hypothetical protein NCAS_0A13100 [Naumovozyma castellii CBS 4309]
MDHLRSLESSLPPEQPPTDNAIEGLGNDLSQEFKIAANAVTKLYRIANEKNSLVKHQGYLQCLDNIIEQIDSGDVSDIQELRHWCAKQRADRLLSKQNNHTTTVTSTQPRNDTINQTIAASNSNLSNIDVRSINVPKFNLSMPPMSIEHSWDQNNRTRLKKKLMTDRSSFNSNLTTNYLPEMDKVDSKLGVRSDEQKNLDSFGVSPALKKQKFSE